MSEPKVFQASEESKATASQLRLFAILAWIVAIGGEIFAILKLIHDSTLVWLVVAIVVILALAIVGNLLWKKAGRLDPPSEANPVSFFLKSQLGAIMSVLAFLPLVIFIFTNKEVSGKTKGIAGVVAIIALLAAGITGVDFNPPSVEKYTKEIQAQTDSLHQIAPDAKYVYWIGESGKLKDSAHKYHIYQDCQYLKGKTNVQQGSIEDAFSKNGQSELCKVCEKRARKANGVMDSSVPGAPADTTATGN